VPKKDKVMAAAAGGMSSTPRGDPNIERMAEEELTYAAIAERAYSYWEARGCQGGSAEEDWRKAIQELTAERQG